MSFLRRKSGVYHDDIYLGDPEPQPKHERRRLSKPHATPISDPSSFSSQQYIGQRVFLRNAYDPPLTSSANDSREAVRSHLFPSASPSTSDSDFSRSKSRGLAMGMSAYMATTVSNDNSTQTSSSQTSLVSPTLPTLPISRMVSAKRASENRKPSISSLGSKDRYATDLDPGIVSPQSSTEQLTPDPAPPARPAAFTPGTATRQSTIIPRRIIPEESESTVSLAEAVIMRKTSVKDVPTVDHERTWSPSSPPAHDRSGTPSNGDVTHIGRLGLGSLHITNGRASPAASDQSKTPACLWAPNVKRETSSCYPESEVGTVKSRRTIPSDWEDEPVPSLAGDGSLRSRPDVYRAFSFNPGTETSFNQFGRVPSVPMPLALPGIDASISEPFAISELLAISEPPEDKTKVMAQQYISDLPTSPFTESPPPASPVLPTAEIMPDTNRFTPPQTPTTEAIPDTSRFTLPQIPKIIPPEPPSVLQPQEHPSSPVSTGSVRRYSDRAHGRRSFIDEPLEQPQTEDRAVSPSSFFSAPAEPEDDNDLPFASAVEIQPMTPRSRSPRKQAGRSPIPAARNSREGQRGPISDSGYSSNTSLGAILPPGELRTPIGHENNVEKDKKRGIRFPFQKMQKSGKPVLVKPTPSTKVPSPTSVRIESVSALTSQTSFLPTESSVPDSTMSLPVSPLKTKGKRNKLIKLRRKSTVEAAGELVVQRLASVDCLNIPPVSMVTRSNLAQRAQAIPELDRTYRTQNHTARSANPSMLSLATAAKEIRFPSPQPEEEERSGRKARSSSRSRSRGRSFSRPRSWLIWPRRDKSGSRTSSKERGNTREELNDLGSVADLLGDNPYDIAQRSRPGMPPSAWNNRPNFLRRQTTPSNISSNNPRPRSSMDDQAASIISSLRRRSASERDNRQSLDERGAAPWKPSHDLHSPTDVPPLPPVPTEEEINRRISYRHGYATHPRPLSYRSNPQSQRNSQLYDEPEVQPYDDSRQWYEGEQPQYEDNQHHNNQYEDSQYLHNQYEDNQYQNNHHPQPMFLDQPHEAPPPPPHSPRPMYLETENQMHYVSEPEHIYTQEEAPLPPRHSPMPSYLDQSRFEHAIEDEALAPPPPSHSPRPMDVTPNQRPLQKSRDPSWSSQANAWNLRRQSAGEALRQSWGGYGEPQSINEPTRQPSSVPRRKPVPSSWTPTQETGQQPSYQPWRSGDFQQQDDELHGRHSHQSAYTQSPAQYQANELYIDHDQHYDQYNQLQHDQHQDQHEQDYARQNYSDDSCYQQHQQRQNTVHRRPLPQHQPNQYNYYQDYNQQQQQQYPNQPVERQRTYPPPALLNNHNSHSPIRQRPSSRHSQRSQRSHGEDSHQDFYSSPVQPRQQNFPPPALLNHQNSRSPTRHRPSSRHSQRSQKSHPEDPHQDFYNSPTRQQTYPHPNQHPISPQPGIGRYSGGLDLNYDLFPRFDTSAGPTSGSPVSRRTGTGTPRGDRTNSMSGRKRHSWLDMESYGQDLDDVPGVPLLVGNVGGRMIYR